MVSEFSIEEDFDVNAWMVENASSFFTFWLLLVIVGVFFGLPAQAAIMRATALIYAGESSPSFVECVKEGFRKLCSIFCFKFSLNALIFAISICIGLLFGIVTVVIIGIFGDGAGAGIQILAQLANLTITYYIMIAMLVAVPSIVVERKTWCKDAMDRSWELTEQKRCFLFAALLVYGFVLMPIVLVYYGIMFAILGTSGVFSAKGVLAYSFLCLVTLPIAHIFNTVLYINLRVEKEACNEQVLANDLLPGSYNTVSIDHDSSGVPYKDATDGHKDSPGLSKEDIV